MTVNKLTYPAKENAVQEKINEIIDNLGASITVDQTYDGTSANPQSGVAIAGAGFLTGINSTDVTTALGYTPADTTLSNVSSIDSNSAVQTALDGKADTSLSNLSATGKTVIDGQWTVVNAYCVQDGTSLKGSSELDFTLNVPNDGNLYEVLLSGGCTTGSTSGNYCALMVRSAWFSGDYVYIAQAQTRTSYALAAMGNVILPLTTSRKIYVYRNSNYNGTCKVKLIGYRRIGSNS